MYVKQVFIYFILSSSGIIVGQLFLILTEKCTATYKYLVFTGFIFYKIYKKQYNILVIILS